MPPPPARRPKSDAKGGAAPSMLRFASRKNRSESRLSLFRAACVVVPTYLPPPLAAATEGGARVSSDKRPTYKRRTTCVSRSEQMGCVCPVATITVVGNKEEDIRALPTLPTAVESSNTCLPFLPQHLARRKGPGVTVQSDIRLPPPPPPQLDAPCSIVTCPDRAGEASSLPSCSRCLFHPALQGGNMVDASAGCHVKPEECAPFLAFPFPESNGRRQRIRLGPQQRPVRL